MNLISVSCEFVFILFFFALFSKIHNSLWRYRVRVTARKTWDFQKQQKFPVSDPCDLNVTLKFVEERKSHEMSGRLIAKTLSMIPESRLED